MKGTLANTCSIIYFVTFTNIYDKIHVSKETNRSHFDKCIQFYISYCNLVIKHLHIPSVSIPWQLLILFAN